MHYRFLKVSSLFLTGMLAASQALADESLREIIDDPARSEAETARDEYRNPYETLTFFGIEPDMAVIELAPGSGWYTEILAPYLRDDGQFIAAYVDPEAEDAPGYAQQVFDAWSERVADTDRYGEITTVPFFPSASTELADSGTADAVLSFRNVHGWKRDGVFTDVVRAAHDALKPGGVFGIVGHRLPEDRSDDEFTGYVKQSWVVAQAEANGFRLAESSDINANPNDTADHPDGVWNLPPSLRGDDEEAKEKYREIGESDRFTLKFVKR